MSQMFVVKTAGLINNKVWLIMYHLVHQKESLFICLGIVFSLFLNRNSKNYSISKIVFEP